MNEQPQAGGEVAPETKAPPPVGSIRLNRVVHPRAGVKYGKLSVLAPDVHFNLPAWHPDADPMALAFVDPDNDTHIYVVTEPGRNMILEMLSGGVIPASPDDLKKIVGT